MGGEFTSIGGQTRNNIAALDSTTGTATSWNPNAGGVPSSVNTLAVSSATVYAGGWFTSIGGQTRNYIAALDAETGMATSWNPNVVGYSVRVLAVSGSTVYAAGDFTSIGGQTRNYLAALDVSTGLATSWDPNPNDYPWTLSISASTVYAGGNVEEIGNTVQPHFAGMTAEVTSVGEKQVLPKEFTLHQNYPNPFNPSTTISFSIPKSSYVTLKVYNLLGQEIETLVDETLQAGVFRVVWSANGFPSGVYFCRIQADDISHTKKIILLR